MEKSLDLALRKGKAVGETKPPESIANVNSEGTHPEGEGACRRLLVIIVRGLPR